MKVAVVGAGISGIGAAFLLAQKYEVHLFESDNRLGGHANTVCIDDGNGTVPMDTGFLVYNEYTYPQLTSFFKYLNVETVNSNMSLSVQVKNKKLEWAGTNLNTIFGQRTNLLRPRFLFMLAEILRFGREAEQNLYLSHRNQWTLGELLTKKKYSIEFATDYLYPIGAAIWSTPEAKITVFPAATFITFFINHKLHQIANRPVWRTVKNGSVQYVKKASEKIPYVYVSTAVNEIERTGDKVQVKTKHGTQEFDWVVMATHTSVSKKILKLQSEHEEQVLSAIEYKSNTAVLHTDSKVMPSKKRCWSSWNVLGTQNKNVSLSYYLNLLQPLHTSRDYFVTLNPSHSLSNTLREFNYDHPQFDQKAIRAQRAIQSIQGRGGVYFAGAWTRFGFHEDGLQSAVNVAEQMGVSPPWKTI